MEEFLQIWASEFKKLNFNWNSFVHKDYELSNLMYLPQKENHLKCGILDFQNAFIGFSGWDLFSLLENPRIDLDVKSFKFCGGALMKISAFFLIVPVAEQGASIKMTS